MLAFYQVASKRAGWNAVHGLFMVTLKKVTYARLKCLISRLIKHCAQRLPFVRVGSGSLSAAGKGEAGELALQLSLRR